MNTEKSFEFNLATTEKPLEPRPWGSAVLEVLLFEMIGANRISPEALEEHLHRLKLPKAAAQLARMDSYMEVASRGISNEALDNLNKPFFQVGVLNAEPMFLSEAINIARTQGITALDSNIRIPIAYLIACSRTPETLLALFSQKLSAEV